MNIAHSFRILPPELVDVVVDYLHNDRKALANFSLVARSWLATSHYHLFHAIQLSKDDFREYSDTMQLLESSSNIRYNIRILQIWSVPACVAPETLAYVLDSLENLHTVCMYGMTCKISVGPPVQWTRTKKLRKLELSGFDAMRGEIVNTMGFFCRVPVGELLLSDWEILPISLHQALHQKLLGDSLDDLLHDWSIDSVVFSHNVGSAALDLVRTISIAENVHSIDVAEQACWAVPERFTQLLRDVGPHLTHLRLDVTGIYTHPVSCTCTTASARLILTYSIALATAMAQCTSLKSLHLYLGTHVYYDRFASVEVATAGFPLTLMSDISLSVQDITFGFGVDYEGDFIKFWTEKVDWGGLERKLLTLKDLKSVHFVWEIPYPAVFMETRLERVPNGVREVIRNSLPRIHAAGKLLL